MALCGPQTRRMHAPCYVKALRPVAVVIDLIRRLIGAITKRGELVVDPAAGSFVMHAARELRREFVGLPVLCQDWR